MKNSGTAIKFLETCALVSPKEAFAAFVHPNFKHHNQYFAGDANSLLEAMTEAGEKQPNKKFEVKQIFDEGDRVAVYSLVVKEKMEIAVVHMLRFENGKIIEMWDVGQVIDKNSPNKNGMF